MPIILCPQASEWGTISDIISTAATVAVAVSVFAFDRRDKKQKADDRRKEQTGIGSTLLPDFMRVMAVIKEIRHVSSTERYHSEPRLRNDFLIKWIEQLQALSLDNVADNPNLTRLDHNVAGRITVAARTLTDTKALLKTTPAFGGEAEAEAEVMQMLDYIERPIHDAAQHVWDLWDNAGEPPWKKTPDGGRTTPSTHEGQ